MVMLRQLSFIEYYFVPVTMHKGLDKGFDLDFSHFTLTIAQHHLYKEDSNS